jgi:hypothetical protein
MLRRKSPEALVEIYRNKIAADDGRKIYGRYHSTWKKAVCSNQERALAVVKLLFIDPNPMLPLEAISLLGRLRRQYPGEGQVVWDTLASDESLVAFDRNYVYPEYPYEADGLELGLMMFASERVAIERKRHEANK